MKDTKPSYRIIASPSSWIEGEAERQLQATANLPGVCWAVGMPDLHPGKGHPIGAAIYSEGIVYPHLVGGDIGCGMALFQTSARCKKTGAEQLAKRFRGIEGPWAGVKTWLEQHRELDGDFASSLGTIGGGNHFAEIQRISETFMPALLDELRLDSEAHLLLVHTGSRGLGESILRAHVAQHGANGLASDGDANGDASTYLRAHDHAVAWARANRAIVAQRIAEVCGFEISPIIDVCHNSVEPLGAGWLHRKGAAPHDRGVVPIPGSRGTLTYLVQPLGDGTTSGKSLAHGAGRKWKRSEARARLRERFRAPELLRTDLGSIVICDDKDLLFEEAPHAYKKIDRVVADLVEAGACRTVAALEPVVTYKTRSEDGHLRPARPGRS